MNQGLSVPPKKETVGAGSVATTRTNRTHPHMGAPRGAAGNVASERPPA